MVFSSLIFLFLFLPVVLIVNYLLPVKTRNIFLFLTGLVFYSWGEGLFVLLMFVTITMNYVVGVLLKHVYGNPRKAIVGLGITFNLLPLFFFKYFEFFMRTLSDIAPQWVVMIFPSGVPEIHLPLGISFFTFQAISYLVDVYRNHSQPQTNPLNLGLYISLFPQLIAGPIVRYGQVAEQIVDRTVNSCNFAAGIERFTIGLSKKVLLANPLGAMSDTIFALSISSLTTPVSWLGITAYTLQIYFDFSGYSDMAIGLGRMLGFTFPENFNMPYAARSLREFWTRWHISLSTWFRDYLYIPMGGNRKGNVKTARNLCIVFLLCGLWHGASWNFIIWGMLHGFFLSLERSYFGRWLGKIPRLFQHGYVMFVVMLCWVFFRTETLSDSAAYLSVMLGNEQIKDIPSNVLLKLTPHFLFVYCTAIFFAVIPVGDIARHIKQDYKGTLSGAFRFPIRFTAVLFLLAVTTSNLATGVYNPFIYFRF